MMADFPLFIAEEEQPIPLPVNPMPDVNDIIGMNPDGNVIIIVSLAQGLLITSWLAGTSREVGVNLTRFKILWLCYWDGDTDQKYTYVCVKRLKLFDSNVTKLNVESRKELGFD